jgi:hypothetical protein
MGKMKKSRVQGALSDTRRLELVIVSATMLVLLIYNKPPKSGNAETLAPGVEMVAERASSLPREPGPVAPVTMRAPQPESMTMEVPEEMPVVDPPPRPKRIGMVDARQTGNPRYTEVMYGEVTVRWIWNGHKSVPNKVCIVDEGGGVTSVWSFDEHADNVIVSEVQPPPDASR